MQFPNVVKIAYSTCSIFVQENEKVVKKVLKSNTDYKLVNVIDFNNFRPAQNGQAKEAFKAKPRLIKS